MTWKHFLPLSFTSTGRKRHWKLLVWLSVIWLVGIQVWISNFKKDLPLLRQELLTELEFQLKGPLSANDSDLIHYIRTSSANYLVPPSTQNYSLSLPLDYYSDTASWVFAIQKLEILFGDEPPGFFVEAGALDGEFLSNTLWLERKRKWTGVLVEPSLVSYRQLLQKNRRAWAVNAGLSARPYPLRTIFSSVEPNQKEIFKRHHLWSLRGQTYEYEKGFKPSGAANFHSVHYSVQCFPLESILLALNVSTVDFWSLDIQGQELEVLKLFPWERIKVRTLIVEYYENSIPYVLSKAIVSYMETVGFVLVGVSVEPDYFFVHKSESFLLSKLNISVSNGGHSIG